jgi:hypothetical protein
MKKSAEDQKLPITTKPTKVTGASSSRPGPKGFVEVEGDSQIFVGRIAGKAPKDKKWPQSSTMFSTRRSITIQTQCG